MVECEISDMGCNSRDTALAASNVDASPTTAAAIYSCSNKSSPFWSTLISKSFSLLCCNTALLLGIGTEVDATELADKVERNI